MPRKNRNAKDACSCGRSKGVDSKVCKRCCGLQLASKYDVRAVVAASLDWAGAPCSRCGHYPLSTHNKSGICRNCQRGESAVSTTAA